MKVQLTVSQVRVTDKEERDTESKDVATEVVEPVALVAITVPDREMIEEIAEKMISHLHYQVQYLKSKRVEKEEEDEETGLSEG